MSTENNNKEMTLNERLAASVGEIEDRDYTPSSGGSGNQGGDDNNNNGIKGYRIAIAILTVILLALSAFYFNIHRQQQADYSLLSVDRDSLQSNLSSIITEFDELQINNDSLKISMEIEKQRADSIITQLQKERSFNYTKLKQYEREVGTLRSLMRGYLQTIDSLNSLNEKLISENVSYKKQISTVELRAEEAEERAQELVNRVKEGSRLRAQDITITSLNASGRDVSRIKRAERLSINFTLVPNELATPGNKEIYARITSPDGYVLSTEDIPTFELNGERVTYSASRKVEYQNTALPVSIFFAGSGFVEGLYKVELYNEDYLIGASDIEMR